MQTPITRRAALGYLAAASVAVSTPAFSQSHYPDRPIKIIVAFAAGGAVDLFARAMARALSQELRQQFVVENRAGATGHIAGEAAARAVADGYALLFTASSAQAVSRHLLRLNYKPQEDLAPVALVVKVPNIVVVNKDLPVNTLADLIRYSKANPGKVLYGSYGPGSNYHLAGEMLASMAGLDLVHVPYNSSQVVLDLLTGRIQLLLSNVTEVEQHLNKGDLRALAITSPSRFPAFPDLPTVAETLPGFNVVSWAMLMAPARTPKEILAQLNEACLKILARPEIIEAFDKQRGTPGNLDLAQTQEFLRVESVRWEKLIQDAKVPMLN